MSSNQVRNGLSGGGRWIRTSGTADDARLLADLYTHNASRQMPQKGSSDQAVACLRRLGAGVVGSAAVCAFRFRPPGTGSKRAGWRRSGAIFAFFAAVCFEPDASRARLRFKAVMRSMTGGGAAISLGLTVSPFSSWLRLVLARPPGNDLDTSSDRNFPFAARQSPWRSRPSQRRARLRPWRTAPPEPPPRHAK